METIPTRPGGERFKDAPENEGEYSEENPEVYEAAPEHPPELALDEGRLAMLAANRRDAIEADRRLKEVMEATEENDELEGKLERRAETAKSGHKKAKDDGQEQPKKEPQAASQIGSLLAENARKLADSISRPAPAEDEPQDEADDIQDEEFDYEPDRNDEPDDLSVYQQSIKLGLMMAAVVLAGLFIYWLLTG